MLTGQGQQRAEPESDECVLPLIPLLFTNLHKGPVIAADGLYKRDVFRECLWLGEEATLLRDHPRVP